MTEVMPARALDSAGGPPSPLAVVTPTKGAPPLRRLQEWEPRTFAALIFRSVPNYVLPQLEELPHPTDDPCHGNATVSVASRFVHFVFGVPETFAPPVMADTESQNRSTPLPLMFDVVVP
jgi:hypothetical protein